MSNPSDFEQHFVQLQASWSEGTLGDADARYLALRDEFEHVAQPMRRALLGMPFAWADEENRQARWLHQRGDEFAALGYRLSSGSLRYLCSEDERARAVIAATLFFMGETVKWDVSISPKAPHDLRKVHALMRIAMECDHHRTPMTMLVDGRQAPCTIESLYFRVLLLARFASGALNGKQIEIIDAWMWRWMPVLTGVATAPAGSALRADLDSAAGLQRGPRSDDGPSLYLAQEPIEAAYHAIVAEFHAGRIVPADGIASEFRIEEHVAVLDLIRQGLKLSRHERVVRAARRRVERPVTIYLGLAEILKRGFMPAAPTPAAVTLADIERRDSSLTRRMTDGDLTHGEICDAERRQVQLMDESETGFGLEGTSAEFGSAAVGDLVAMRIAGNGPLVLGKVVRCVPRSIGRVFVGVRRFPAASQLLEVRREPADRPAEQLETLFVPGEETTGRSDACIVPERVFVERAPFIARIDDVEFKLRLNRVRERGRGWVLAGYEVVSARSAIEIA